MTKRRSGALVAPLLLALAIVRCGSNTAPVGPTPTPSLTAAQAYEALSTDTGFKFCRDVCGPNALVRMLTGVKQITFPTSMAADVKRLEDALSARAAMVTLTTLPPGSDGGRGALVAADDRVRADLSLPALKP